MLKEEKINREKAIIKKMIKIYCKSHCNDPLCQECQELLDYAYKRIDKCPFIETKTFCSRCKIKCYDKKMQEKIKQVMKYSGKRMLFYDPILAIKHLLDRS